MKPEEWQRVGREHVPPRNYFGDFFVTLQHLATDGSSNCTLRINMRSITPQVSYFMFMAQHRDTRHEK